MRGCLRQWPAWTLAAAMVSSASLTAVGQDTVFRPPFANLARVTAVRPISTLPTAQSPARQSCYVPAATSRAEEASLADRVADLETELKKLKEKEAVAKKKSAGKPSLKVGGRIMYDWAVFDQDAASKAQPYGNILNGGEFRQARLFAQGEAFHVVDYMIQFDFAGYDTNFKDVYIQVKELPWLQHVKMGHFKEPYGLEQQTSRKFMTFMERSIADEGALVFGRNIGIMAYGHWAGENTTWAIGAFKDQAHDNPPIFQSDHTATALTMRYTWLPWYDEATGGRGLLHLGVAYSARDAQDNMVHFAARPEAHLSEAVVDTDDITLVDGYQALGLEAALVCGPLSVQGEYFNTWVDRAAPNNPHFTGYYVYVSYFLTGENRVYQRSRARFYRVKPYENFFQLRDCDGNVQTGLGAWEVGYRYSHLNLDDAAIAGGLASDHTFGVNWYLNPYTRMMFNYINSEVTHAGMVGNVNVLEMRAQIDF